MDSLTVDYVGPPADAGDDCLQGQGGSLIMRVQHSDVQTRKPREELLNCSDRSEGWQSSHCEIYFAIFLLWLTKAFPAALSEVEEEGANRFHQSWWEDVIF